MARVGAEFGEHLVGRAVRLEWAERLRRRPSGSVDEELRRPPGSRERAAEDELGRARGVLQASRGREERLLALGREWTVGVVRPPFGAAFVRDRVSYEVQVHGTPPKEGIGGEPGSDDSSLFAEGALQ